MQSDIAYPRSSLYVLYILKSNYSLHTSSPKTGSSITIQRKLTNLWKYQDQSKNLFGTPMKPPGICLKLRLSFVSYVVASYTEHSRILKLNFPTKQNITKWKSHHLNTPHIG